MYENNYPFNLIRAIYGDDRTDNTHTETTYIKGLFEQLKTLTKDEQTILSLRYKDGLMVKACAERFGVKPAKVSQIINGAMRKLRHRSRSLHYESVQKIELYRLEKKYRDVYEENQTLKETLQSLSEHEIDPQAIILLSNVLELHHLESHISELRLSTRANNGLRRAGISTIKDLIAIPETELIQLRNIGEKTMEELKVKIKAHIFYPGINQNGQGDVDTNESNTL